jgi:hypothetical protein
MDDLTPGQIENILKVQSEGCLCFELHLFLQEQYTDIHISQAEYASTPFLLLTLALIKWSICVFINHLSPNAVHYHLDLAFRSTIGLWLSTAAVVSVFQCEIPRPWSYIDQTSCINRVCFPFHVLTAQRCMLSLKASLVDLHQCAEHADGVWVRLDVYVDHRKASHIGSEKNHSSSGFLD